MRLALLVPAAAAAAIVAGCGAGDDASPPAGAPETSLNVVYRPLGDDGEATEWRLECGPVGGDHAQAADACALLDELEDEAFEPLPGDTVCTQIYGGPDRARVHGEWRGRAVDVELSREDGCQIARWDSLVPVVPAPGA